MLHAKWPLPPICVYVLNATAQHLDSPRTVLNKPIDMPHIPRAFVPLPSSEYYYVTYHY